MVKRKIILDKYGSPYIPIPKKILKLFPDNISLTFDGTEYHYFIEPRMYLPFEKDNLIVNELLAIKYLTSRNMSQHLDELIEGK